MNGVCLCTNLSFYFRVNRLIPPVMWASFVFPPCNFFSFDSPLAMLNFLDSPLGCTF